MPGRIRIVGAIAGLVLLASAAPAGATSSTTTDLRIASVIVHNVTTFNTTTTASPGDKVKFAVVVKNGGPDSAANVTVTMTSSSNFKIQMLNPDDALSCILPYGGGIYSLTSCYNLQQPLQSGGAGMKAKIKGWVIDGSGPVTATFCASVTISSGQVDPNSSNDCMTASMPVV